MVRLKGSFLFAKYSDIEFQFQYGAIKRKMKSKSWLQFSIFQFQYGAIKRTRVIRSSCSLIPFQFQYGAIKSVYNKTFVDTDSQISIPIWCD